MIAQMPRLSKYGFEKLQPGMCTMIEFANDVPRDYFVRRIGSAVNSWRRRGYKLGTHIVEKGVEVKMIARPKQ